MIYFYGLTQTIPGMAPVYSLADKFDLQEKYPDLDWSDILLIEDFISAHKDPDNQREKYFSLRNKMFARMNQLKNEFRTLSNNKKEQVSRLAKLLNYLEVMREYSVAPNYFTGLNMCEEAENLRQSGGEGLSENITDEVKLALDVAFKGLNFIDYIGGHIRNIFYVKNLPDHVNKLKLNQGRAIGTCEQITRSVMIETYDEQSNGDFEPWMIASNLVHEAAHIDYFYRYASDPQKQKLNMVERYAYIMEIRYLCALRDRIKKDITVSEISREKIEKRFLGVAKKIMDLNKELGLDSENFNLSY